MWKILSSQSPFLHKRARTTEDGNGVAVRISTTPQATHDKSEGAGKTAGIPVSAHKDTATGLVTDYLKPGTMRRGRTARDHESRYTDSLHSENTHSLKSVHNQHLID